MNSDVIRTEIDRTAGRVDDTLQLLAARARTAEQAWKKWLVLAVTTAGLAVVVVGVAGAVSAVAGRRRMARLLKEESQRRCT